MKKINTQTMVNQFKRSFGKAALNELGKITRFFQRERIITPHRLAMSLIEAFAGGNINSIADLQRAFNALCEQTSAVQTVP